MSDQQDPVREFIVSARHLARNTHRNLDCSPSVQDMAQEVVSLSNAPLIQAFADGGMTILRYGTQCASAAFRQVDVHPLAASVNGFRVASDLLSPYMDGEGHVVRQTTTRVDYHPGRTNEAMLADAPVDWRSVARELAKTLHEWCEAEEVPSHAWTRVPLARPEVAELLKEGGES